MQNQMSEQSAQKRPRVTQAAPALATKNWASPLPHRAQRLVTSTSGLSLVEVLVASAIIAIVSVLLVYAFYTMGSVSRRASDITNADETLSEDIALGTSVSPATPGTLQLGDIEIDTLSNTYTTDDDRSLLTFEYKGD
jgi:prepilin-type N-terminal cleavage/methylation domain-containing protein